MKSLSYLKVLSAFVLVTNLASLAFADETGDLVQNGDPSISAPGTPSDALDPVAASSAAAGEEKVDQVIAQQKVNCSVADTSSYGLSTSCSMCAQQAVNCCQNPEACGEGMGFSQTISNLAQQAPAYGALFAGAGEGGAQVQCYAQAIGLLGSLFASDTMSKVCKQLREGNEEVRGCDNVCTNAKSAIRAELGSITPGPTTMARIELLQKMLVEANDKHQACMTDTNKAESDSSAQAAQLASQAQQAMSCMDGLGDEEVPDTVVEPEVDCTLPEYQHLFECEKIAFKPNPDDDGIDLDDALLVDDPGLGTQPDEFNNTDGPRDFNPDNYSKAGGAGMGMGAGAGGGFPPGAAGAGSSEDGKKRGTLSAKAKSLVGGYRSSASTGSGGRGKRGKGFSKFKLDKDKKKKDEADKLKALAAFSKAGISPYSAGFIFERITNRFNASCNPKQFFDCSRNKVSWHEQKKFKKAK